MSTILQQLHELRAEGVISPIDWQFANYIGRIDATPEVILAAAAVSHALGQQNSCVDLQQRCAAGEAIAGSGIAPPPLPQWRQALRDSAVVATPGQLGPLMLEQNRLYLSRYHYYEGVVASGIGHRSRPEAVDEAWLGERLGHYFSSPPGEFDGQKLAAAVALSRRFCLIAGGPGTGKTTTVVKVLALLREWGQRNGLRQRIAMAAPTGKAAARLAQAIRSALLHDPAIDSRLAAGISSDVTTVHRLLGPLPGSTRFRHTADSPLSCDILLIDEASMLDLGLMAQLLSALRPHARLILLGDRDQLPSVGVGQVLQDLFASLPPEDVTDGLSYSPPQRQLLERLCAFELPPATGGEPGVGDGIALLRHSYRFTADSGIGELAAAVKAGDASAARGLLQHAGKANADDLEQLSPDPGSEAWLEKLAAPYLELTRAWLDHDLGEVEKLRLLDHYRILCALREGSTGVTELNQKIERYLSRQGLAPPLSGSFAGKPIMIVENSYPLQLYNGDTGILLRADGGQLYACFEGAEGTPRRLPLGRLPLWESSYAISVHKSQGSEYRHAALVLPPADALGSLSPLLTRELIYTAITRARDRLTLACSVDVFCAGLSRRVHRASGLAEKLGGAAVSLSGLVYPSKISSGPATIKSTLPKA